MGHLIKGLCSGIMLMCSYKSIEFMPLGDALTILFSSPLFTSKYKYPNKKKYVKISVPLSKITYQEKTYFEILVEIQKIKSLNKSNTLEVKCKEI